MSNEIVFKFVALRAPVGRDESAGEVIEPPDGVEEPFLDEVSDTDESLPHTDRVRIASDRVVASGDYLLNNERWGRCADRIRELVAAAAIDASTFRERASSILSDAAGPNDNWGPESWNDKSLRRPLWTSYIASIFSSGERGSETRLLLNLIRVSFGYERSLSPGFDLAALSLPSTRVALPARVALGPERDTAQQPDSRRPSGGTGNEDAAGKEIADLAHAMKVLAKAKRQRIAQAVAHTASRQAAVEAGTATEVRPRESGRGREGGRNVTSRRPATETAGISLPLVRAESPEGRSHGGTTMSIDSLRRIAAEDLGDADAARTLARYGLDPGAGVEAVRTRILQMIASKSAAAARSRTRAVLTWERGTFVRVKKRTTIGGRGNHDAEV